MLLPLVAVVALKHAQEVPGMLVELAVVEQPEDWDLLLQL